MNGPFLTLLRRDLRNLLTGAHGSGAILPLLFFLSIAMLYPFAVGPNPTLLAKTGGGIVWIAALLAAILPLDGLISRDLETGFFDQFRLRGISEEWVCAARLIAHWLSFGPLLILACIPAAALLGLERQTVGLLMLGLLAGTPGLAAVGLMIAALTASLRSGAALAGLMLVPLALPILIFGAGALARSDPATLGFAGAISLLLVAVAPFAAGASIRAAREG